MMRAFYFLDERDVDGVVGGHDVYKEGLVSVRLVEDKWRGKGCFQFLEDLFTIVSPREPGGFL